MTRHTGSSALAAAVREPVLVTGGTGFLGAALTRRLLVDGVRVRILARSPAKARPLADLGAQITIGDITDRAAVCAAVDGIRVVYHLAGPLLVPGVPATEYQRTHVLGTKLLLDCCAEMPDMERVVYCSTTGVLGVTGDRPASEEAAFRPTNDYERAKADAEVAVRRRWRDAFPVVIARPGLVYGPGDIHLLPFFQRIQRGFFRPIGRQKAWLHPIYIDDMTEALVRCGQRRAAVGECFHLAGKEPVPIRELASVIARAEGTRLPSGYIPVFAAQVVAGFGDRLPARLRERAPLTRSRLDFLTHSRVYDVSKAQWLLDFAAATDLTTGITQTVAWYRKHGYLPPQAASRPSTARTAKEATEGAEKGVPECEFGITSLSPRRVRCSRPRWSAAARSVSGRAACSSMPTTMPGSVCSTGPSVPRQPYDSSIKRTRRGIRRRACCMLPRRCCASCCSGCASDGCSRQPWAWPCMPRLTRTTRHTWTGRGPRPWRGMGTRARCAGGRRRRPAHTCCASRCCCPRIGWGT